ncbi:MurR/RpiR family transcriptional regulator [Microlunatus soli]|uniref:DNA-binding transcriptional regulator, MurR/RpiR family, contains HTH and SIS domains n=1 Tax=Microlunatus soli TaxID=630515 RepID=A0A1H1U1V5_9ACTN|nr:MurR/RpiR family transcriptional regulator [Microlunatus soli]SDS66457.1 DNA-binding transcriptional regulator, MurR/RpiR family, contains HTH and SIS domains [Microlunatus soli]
MSTAETTSVRDRIAAATLRPSERRVSLRLLTDYPSAGLSTTGALATAAAVSTQTVIRFVRALGFDSFADFRDALREEVRTASQGPEPVEGPLSKLGSKPEGETADLTGFARVVGERTARGFDRIPAASIDATIDLLTDLRGDLVTAGGRFTEVLARHLAFNLQAIRPGVRLLDDPMGASLATMIDLGPRDVVVLFDVERYQPAIRRLAEAAAERGASVVVVTDEPGTAAADFAVVTLIIDVEAPSPLDTLAGGVLLVEYLVARAIDRLDSVARDRLSVWETARSSDFD